MRHQLLLSVLSLTSVVEAQLALHTVPNAAKTLPGWAASALPLGRSRCTMQSWYRGDNLPVPAQLRSIGWRVEFGLGRMTGDTYALEVVLANSPVTFSTFSATYAANLGAAPQTFVALRSVSFPAADATHLDQPGLWLPGDAPFVFLGPHLVVQVDNQTTTTPTSRRYTTDRFQSQNVFTGNPVSPVVSNCGGSLRPSYSSSLWTLNLTNAAPNQPVTFLIGSNHTVSGLPLPLDLGILGLVGCRLDVGPIVDVAGIADAVGTATFRIRYTHASSSALVLLAQALHVDRNNPGLPAVSTVASTVFGMTGYCNEITSLSTFGPIAEFGPATRNEATIVLFR